MGTQQASRAITMRDTPYISKEIKTEAVRHALTSASDVATIVDLLFLEAWELGSMSSVAATLRAAQIRRANPELAAQIRQEAQAIRAGTSRHIEALDAASVRFLSDTHIGDTE